MAARMCVCVCFTVGKCNKNHLMGGILGNEAGMFLKF